MVHVLEDSPLGQPRLPARIIRHRSDKSVDVISDEHHVGADWDTVGVLPATYPEWLGDIAFAQAHRARFAYVSGEMANGIAGTRLVTAMAQEGLLGIFGAAGLPAARVEAAVHQLGADLGDQAPWGVNVIHSPHEPRAESDLVALLLRAAVPCVSFSAFTLITPALAWCATAGLRREPDGHSTAVALVRHRPMTPL